MKKKTRRGLCLTLAALALLAGSVSALETGEEPAAQAVVWEIDVNEEVRPVRMYALADETGYEHGYIAIRDLAALLEGTQGQFDVSWTGVVKVETGAAYCPEGAPCALWGEDKEAVRTAAATEIDGEVRTLDALLVREDGGGCTYYQLRELCRALGLEAGWSAERGVYLDVPEVSAEGRMMLAEGEKYMGTPYVWAGSAPGGFDCSGFVYYVINHCGSGRSMGRTSAQVLYDRCIPIGAGEVRAGDLIFFTKTYKTSAAVTHVGICDGQGRMLHCGSAGVCYADLDAPRWQEHFYAYARLP